MTETATLEVPELLRPMQAFDDDQGSHDVSPTRRRYPWFGVGNDISQATTAEQACAESRLDWAVELQPMYRYRSSTRSYAKVPDRFVSVRLDTDEAIGSVGRTYVPWQNAQAFEFADPLIADGLASYWSGGELHGGAQAFLVLRFSAEFQLVGGSNTELFLLMQTSHDGSRSIQAVVTPIEAFCTNQVSLILRTAPMKWRVGHYRTANEKLAAAHETLRGMSRYAQELRVTSERLAAINLELAEFERVLVDVLPARPRTQKMISEITATRLHSPTVRDEFRNTAWGAVSATTEYLDHRRASRSSAARMLSIQNGFGAGVRNAVAQRLLALG